MNESRETLNGPVAPRDPEEKRPVVYLVLDSNVEGSPRGENFENVFYLDGRVAANVKAIAPGIEIAEGLQTCEGLRTMVHSIGVSIIADETQNREAVADFALRCKNTEGYNGTHYEAKIPCNGQEVRIPVAGHPYQEKDTTLESLHTFFPYYMTGVMTVCFYMNDGYDVPEVTPDPPVDFECSTYQQMKKLSLMNLGNLYRLQKAIEKAKRGEDVTIAYIGGSITQGAGAKPISTQCYAYQSYRMFRERYGKGDGENVHYVKAGVGGTDSELGLCRYDEDVLKHGMVTPDIVVMEYAVNDAGDETHGVCYESLALKAMEGAGHPAVVLLFAVFMDDFNLQENLSKAGYAYDLPMVSVKNAVTKQFYDEKPVITKRQYFFDMFHPTNNGHRVMAECLDYLWEQAGNAQPCIYDTDLSTAPGIGNRFRELQAFTRKNAEDCPAVKSIEIGSFMGVDRELQCVERDLDSFCSPEFEWNWMHTAGTHAQSFRMKLHCKDLLIVHKDAGDQAFGKAEVQVDGKYVRTLDPLSIGWTHCTASIILESETAEEHVVEVSVLPADGSRNFTILGFGYTK